MRGTNGVEMRDKAVDLIQRLPVGAVVLPVQTLGDLFNVLVRKAKRPAASARTAILTWRGVTVTNPFAVARHPLLDVLLTKRND